MVGGLWTGLDIAIKSFYISADYRGGITVTGLFLEVEATYNFYTTLLTENNIFIINFFQCQLLPNVDYLGQCEEERREGK